MTTNLGENPWILILLTFLELLLVLIPAFIAGKVEKKSFKEELNEMGFCKNTAPFIKNLHKIISGLLIGFIFFLIGGFIIIFFKYFIVENIFGASFVKEGEQGAIKTDPIQPTILQIIIIIILQVIIVGICEEAFFRGFIIKKCEKKMNLIYAVLFSSICFAFYHIPPFLVPLKTIITYFGYFFTFGILLALVYLYFDYSLIPCVVAHSFFNILILIL
ncbi:MAG: lysostaphin resistance A-like protein [Promethearchaeota archaeon]